MQDETVHERVRRLRERKKLSQAELAAATGDVVTESWLQKFENKHSPKYPTREQLEPLVEPLGTSLGYLMAPMGVVPIEDSGHRSGVVIAGREFNLNEDDTRIVETVAERLQRQRGNLPDSAG